MDQDEDSMKVRIYERLILTGYICIGGLVPFREFFSPALSPVQADEVFAVQSSLNIRPSAEDTSGQYH